MTIIVDGEQVLLYLNEKRKWIVEAREGRDFHTHMGIVRLGEIIGKNLGSCVTSTLGVEFYLLSPTLSDRIHQVRRPTQILYDKDIGLCLHRLGLGPGSRVIEAGTGSGAMTASLANIVRPWGHIYTYEIRPEFLEAATRNLEKMRLSEYVTFRNADAKEGFEEKDIDAAFVDLGDPWLVIPPAHTSLKGGRPLASFSPTINQVERVVEAMTGKFVDIETLECLVRSIRVEKGKTRPMSMMVGHTGYLTFGRKISKE